MIFPVYFKSSWVECSRASWCVRVGPAIQEAEASGYQVCGQPEQLSKTPFHSETGLEIQLGDRALARRV